MYEHLVPYSTTLQGLHGIFGTMDASQHVICTPQPLPYIFVCLPIGLPIVRSLFPHRTLRAVKGPPPKPPKPPKPPNPNLVCRFFTNTPQGAARGYLQDPRRNHGFQQCPRAPPWHGTMSDVMSMPFAGLGEQGSLRSPTRPSTYRHLSQR